MADEIEYEDADEIVEEEEEVDEVDTEISMRVAEAYVSIQGEGLYIGVNSLFIRLNGCNQRCLWCDTQNIKEDPRWNANTIGMLIRKHVEKGYDVVVTGGEPLIQPDAVAFIINTTLGYKEVYGSASNITIETNGTCSPYSTGLSEDVLAQVFWSVSPKLRSSGQIWKNVQFKDFLRMSNMQFKFPIDPYSMEDKEDFETIMLFIPSETVNVVVQPVATVGIEMDEYPAVVDELIEYIKPRFPRVRVIPQMHKFVWGMNSKSV